MKRILFVAAAIYLVLFLSGCRTTRPVVPFNPVDTIAVPSGELRGYYVHPESWVNDDLTIEKEKVGTLMGKVAEGYHNAVYFFTEDKQDILEYATLAAHERGLRLYAGFSLPEVSADGPGGSLPREKAEMKNIVRQLATQNNIDGLFMRIDGHSPDLIEDIAVEALLVKPYLIISVIYNGEIEYQNALKCLEEGIADLIIPENELAFANPECLPLQYSDKVSLPKGLKKTTTEQIVGLDFSKYFTGDPGGQIININGKIKITDTDGQIGFITNRPDTIRVETSKGTILLPTANWSVPYRYAVLPGNTIARTAPWVEFRKMPRVLTNTPDFDLLCKTDYPASVFISGQSVKQYKTGIFFNKITLKEGPNRIRATVITNDSLTAFYENEYTYEKIDRTRKPFPLWIDDKTVTPSASMELLPEDMVKVSFQGSKEQEGFIVLSPGGLSIKCARTNYGDYSQYTAEIPLAKLVAGMDYNITLRLQPVTGSETEEPVELRLPNQITVRDLADFPMVKVTKEYSRLIYNLGAPRLGGPVRSEVNPGVVMKTNGKIGENYRIRLSRVENGFIHQSEVEVLGSETVIPTYYITSMSCGPSNGFDILSIPYLEPVPYEVYPEPDQNRIVITLYGAESSNTWITHRAGRKIIDKITWQQTTPETFQTYVNLNTPEIWGYDVRVEGTRLVLRVKYPPVYDLNGAKPLSGLKIAIEAGHGGTGTGAIGLSGLVEKDINLDLSFRLGDLLKSMGAEIVQVREADIDMTLTEKRDIAIRSGAHMLISIHANAGGTGYLQVPGTSTYWHNPYWAPLAETIYARLLELGLAEFGVIGSFNYTVTRVSQMPSVLVEQAFMTHAEDEEKMADPEFRQKMAQKIAAGIIDYLKRMKNH